MVIRSTDQLVTTQAKRVHRITDDQIMRWRLAPGVAASLRSPQVFALLNQEVTPMLHRQVGPYPLLGQAFIRQCFPLQNPLELAQARRGPAYCRAAGSAVYHGIASAHPLLLPELHEAYCGWLFGLVREVARFDVPPTHLRHKVGGQFAPAGACKKCWRPEGEAVAPEAEGAG